MILQALAEYYQRKMADPENSMAPIGWEWKEIPFLLVINERGELQAIQDTREQKGNRLRAKAFLVMQGEKRSSAIKPNLLWDNVEYVLGVNPRGRKDISKRHEAFKRRIAEEFTEGEEPTVVLAVKKFLENNPIKQIEQKTEYSELWKEILNSNAFVTFKLEGNDSMTIFDDLRDTLPKEKEDSGMKWSVCLVSGKKAYIPRTHPAIKGVRGTNTSGAAVVSFNLDAFSSYGKEQNLNAPLSKRATFEYTTALNFLLGKDSENNVTVGNTTIVFWAEKRDEQTFDMEGNFPWFIADPPKDDPDRGVRAVRALYEFAASGKMPAASEERFYVLGLAPNTARISVRLWRSGTLKEFAEKIIQHFEDINIIKSPNDPEYLTLSQLVRSTALDNKTENVLPKLAGDVLTSVIDGTPYPRTLLQQCISRIRAERRVGRTRAAILKGCINRFQKNYAGLRKEALGVGLDKSNKNTAYRLGRLFSVLEKIQEESHPNINTTIRDRFYGAASSSPVSVFPQLLKLKNHHLAKLESKSRKLYFEREIGEIMEEINSFPRYLTIDQQALFAIGYYHQRQDFFQKRKNDQ